MDGASERDVKKADAIRKRARAYLKQAQETGLDHPLLAKLLEEIAPDGSIASKVYSPVKAANDAIHEGEIAFQNHNYPSAINHYKTALEFDPKCYVAALFTGDVYFMSGDNDAAIQWFSKAATIDPNREQAYRYWGDALARTGKPAEAGQKYAEAVVAEPFNQITWRMLSEWAKQHKFRTGHPAFAIPRANVSVQNEKVTLSVDPNIGVLGMAYGTLRSVEASKAVKEKRPYRHTVAEEVLALKSLLLLDITEEKNTSFEVTTSLNELKMLAGEGYLEAYIFFTRADADIATEYDAYLQNHRAKLLRYLSEKYLTRIE